MPRREQLESPPDHPLDTHDTGRDYGHAGPAPVTEKENAMTESPGKSIAWMIADHIESDRDELIACETAGAILDSLIHAPDWTENAISPLIPRMAQGTTEMLTADQLHLVLRSVTYELLGVVSDMAEDIHALEVRETARQAIRRTR